MHPPTLIADLKGTGIPRWFKTVGIPVRARGSAPRRADGNRHTWVAQNYSLPRSTRGLCTNSCLHDPHCFY
jgi:hypothetical protein